MTKRKKTPTSRKKADPSGRLSDKDIKLGLKIAKRKKKK
jgi:hypothetical protein